MEGTTEIDCTENISDNRTKTCPECGETLATNYNGMYWCGINGCTWSNDTRMGTLLKIRLNNSRI